MNKTNADILRGIANWMSLYEAYEQQAIIDLRRIADDIDRKVPSDEEIEAALTNEVQNIPERFSIERRYYKLGWQNCAKWMRDKMTGK